MKGFMRKAAALLLIVAMAVAAFAGCSKDSGSTSGKNKSADTMFGLLKEAGQLEKKTFETTMEIDADGTKVSITLNGVSDGKATSAGVNVSASGMTFEFEDVLVFTDDVLYLNAGQVLEQLTPFLEASDVDVDSLGLDLDWVCFEAKGLFKTSSYDELFDILDKSYKEIIEKDGSGYKISLSDKDGVQAFVDATIAMIKDNKDTFIDMFVDAYERVDVEAIVNDFADEFVDKLADASGEDVTEDQKAELKEQLMEETDLSELEIDKAEIEEMYEEMLGELEDSEVTDDLGGTVNIKVFKDGDSYVSAVDMDVEEDGEQVGASVKTTITEDKSASVEIPSDAKSLVDVIVEIYMLSAMAY